MSSEVRYTTGNMATIEKDSVRLLGAILTEGNTLQVSTMVVQRSSLIITRTLSLQSMC